MELEERARVHAALGDPHRLAMVDALWASDLTPSELAELTGLSSNLLAFHLDALEDADLISRHRSQGDRRRRYVTLRPDRLLDLGAGAPIPEGPVLFVCTHNSARSQLAAALWQRRTGGVAASAGTEPAERVHPLAAAVAARHGLDMSGLTPRSYEHAESDPALVVSVCDRARESGLPFASPLVHWSVPDPAGGKRADFERAFAMIAERVDRLAGQAAA